MINLLISMVLLFTGVVIIFILAFTGYSKSDYRYLLVGWLLGVASELAATYYFLSWVVFIVRS